MRNVAPVDEPILRLVSVRPERFKAAFKPDAVALNDFNVIAGRNGSGKSTLLECLQWLDVAIRRDAREACDRYFGIADLINLRSQAKTPYFLIELRWSCDDDDEIGASYSVKVVDDDGIPRVSEESLEVWDESGKRAIVSTVGGVRVIGAGESRVRVVDADRLALALVGDTQLDDPVVRAISNFWSDAVFLRLSPSRLSQGSAAVKRSFEPILDEEGNNLAALLYELSEEERIELTGDLAKILPGIRKVDVMESGESKNKRVNYRLFERMPYRGRSGKYELPVPAWMLSEGTRRVTALLALMKRNPAPSILCIEEIENGLDPWTVQSILRHLRSASRYGTQLIVTTHSPWLLDHVERDAILVVQRRDGDTRYTSFATDPEVLKFSPSLPAGTIYSNLEFSPGSAE